MAKIRDHNVILLLWILQIFEKFGYGALNQDHQKFNCTNGGQINFIQVCDGISDCKDESDEAICENEAILFYYTEDMKVPPRKNQIVPSSCRDKIKDSQLYNNLDCAEYDGFVKLELTGIYLRNRIEFSIPLIDASIWNEPEWDYGKSWSKIPRWKDIGITSIERQIDMFYTDRRSSSNNPHAFIKRVTRTGTFLTSKSEDIIKSLATDLVTSSIYYITDSSMKTCDKDFTICKSISSKFIKDPVLLTIASKARSLFWIERRSVSKFSLFKYSLDGSSTTRRINFTSPQYFRSPLWLTVDSVRDRLYWMEMNINTVLIYSTKFDGTDLEQLKIVPPSSSKSIVYNRTISFAVFNGTLYYPDNVEKKIWSCSTANCTKSNVFKTVSTSNNVTINHLIIDHRPLSLRKIRHSCMNSTCSHLCLPSSENTHSYNCYCDGSDKPLLVEKNNGYCEDSTLLATYQNYLYIVALAKDRHLIPRIHKNNLNISSIANVVYNAINGNVILTEMNEQNIYSWTPRNQKLELIFKNGPGTIHSIEFDDYANNLYWVNPINFTINVMNLRTHFIRTILRGNFSYYPTEIALVPQTGYMFVMFFKNNKSVVMERVSMDGLDRTQKILYEDTEAQAGNISLHYIKYHKLLCLLDRQRNEIRYFSDDNEFQDMTKGIEREIENIASLKQNIIWSEDDGLVIKQAPVNKQQKSSGEIRFEMGIPEPNIPLGSGKFGSGVMKIVSITKSNHQSTEEHFGCLPHNGPCDDSLMCITSERKRFMCLCTDSQELTKKAFCQSIISKNLASSVIVREHFDIPRIILFYGVLFVLVHFQSANV